MIISGFMLSWLVGKPMPVQAAAGLQSEHGGANRARDVGAGRAGLRVRCQLIVDGHRRLVAILTLLSIAFYLAEWLRHMNSFGTGH